MTHTALPATAEPTLDWGWERWQPAFAALEAAPLEPAGLDGWMRAWTELSNLISETYARLSLATTLDTADEAAEARFRRFIGEVYPQITAADQRLKQRLLESGLEPEEFAVQLRDMRGDAELFREANLPLLAEERRLSLRYNAIIAGQIVEWQPGRELTLQQLAPFLQDSNRALREDAWRRAAAVQLSDRAELNQLWAELYELRQRQAANAGLPDYRAYAWRQRRRHDYTPDDAARFHEAIAAAVVPAAARIYARRAARLGLDRLRPWDVEATTREAPPLRPFAGEAELVGRGATVFSQVDSELGAYFETMRAEGLLDLENRRGKAPGAYCTAFATLGRPFIFMNAVGTAADVRTLLHEAGHAFHVFEVAKLPYAQQRQVPMEFAEVASMAMELLAAPYLGQGDGGYYGEADYARARVEHLEGILLFWPYMAVVDGFQHWAYTNPAQGGDPAACDEAWGRLWERFMVGVDWGGLEAERVTGWHRKQHIFRTPFYYVEYGLAQLGAVQVWRNALGDQAGALAAYRGALALGSTRPLPELFSAAGARLAFDTATMQEAVDLLEQTIAALGG